MRTKHTKKYAQYYLFLEKSIVYYHKYQLLLHEKMIQQINQIKLLQLQRGPTLDNFVIMKDDTRDDFKYCFVRGSSRNIRETMSDLGLESDNIILKIQVPSQQNFCKKITETLRQNLRREKVFFNKITHEKFFESEQVGDVAFENHGLWITTITRWFKLIDFTEQDFLKRILDLNQQRFDM